VEALATRREWSRALGRGVGDEGNWLRALGRGVGDKEELEQELAKTRPCRRKGLVE